MCHVCGEIVIDPTKQEGNDCPREIFDRTSFRVTVVDQCAGKLWQIRYKVFDLETKKWWSRDLQHPLTLSDDYAGVFDDTDLSTLLEGKYGTSDRRTVQTRCTIIVIPREGLPF